METNSIVIQVFEPPISQDINTNFGNIVNFNRIVQEGVLPVLTQFNTQNISSQESNVVVPLRNSSKSLPLISKAEFNNSPDSVDFVNNININNRLNDSVIFSFDIIYTDTPNISIGDVVSSSIFNRPVLAYINNLQYINDSERGNIVSVECRSFVSRLEEYSFLANNNLKESNNPIKFQREVNQGINSCVKNTLAELITIFSDIVPEAYYSGFFYASDSNYSVMSTIAGNYARNIISRIDGNIYISQLFGSQTTSSFFNLFNADNWEISYSTLTENYTTTPYQTEIIWNNSILVTDSFITGQITFNDYPNKNTLFSNITTIPLNLNPNIGQGVLNANFNVIDSSPYTLQANSPILKNTNSKISSQKLEQYIRLQIVSELFKRIQSTKILNLETVMDNENIYTDIGDTLLYNSELYSVTNVNIDIDSATVMLEAVPLQYTNPVVNTRPGQ